MFIEASSLPYIVDPSDHVLRHPAMCVLQRFHAFDSPNIISRSINKGFVLGDWGRRPLPGEPDGRSVDQMLAHPGRMSEREDVCAGFFANEGVE